MAGYWPNSFFVCLWTRTEPRSINSQKKTRPISSHLDRTNLVNKGLIIWLSGKFFLRDIAGSPERARWLHFCPLGQPITTRDLGHLAHSRSQPYNNAHYCTTRRASKVKALHEMSLVLPTPTTERLQQTVKQTGLPVLQGITARKKT